MEISDPPKKQKKQKSEELVQSTFVVNVKMSENADLTEYYNLDY